MNQAELMEHLNYDEITGVFTWKKNSKNTTDGSRAGCEKDGYWRIYLNLKQYYAHRLAFVYMTGSLPKYHVDHIDGNKLNNAFSNLRDVPLKINNQNNRKARADNVSGIIGAFQTRFGWDSSLCVDGKRIRLGSFKSPLLANEAYVAAKRIHHAGCTI